MWLQRVLPKVNHRLRSFKGLRSWMVDFLGGGVGVEACGRRHGAGGRSAACGMGQAAWGMGHGGGAWGRSATCGMWHEASDMQSAAGGRRRMGQVLPKVNHRLRSFNGLRPWMVDFTNFLCGFGVTFCIKPQFRAPDSCPD